MFSGGQPPFDHRRIPETVDDVDTVDAHLGCLVLLGALVSMSVLGFLLTKLM